MNRKHATIFGVLGVIVLGLLVFFVFFSTEEPERMPPPPPPPAPVQEATTTPLLQASSTEVIGTSLEGRDISATTFGNGVDHILFVGGIHGGYEWNSVLLAYRMIDYLDTNPEDITENLKVTVIPVLNPDGLFEVTGTNSGNFTAAEMPSVNATKPARFNANDVDLNRNFACNWQPTSTWQGRTVSAGESAFSEPEAQALRSFVTENRPDAALFLHSASGAIYGSSCNQGMLPETRTVMNTYASAAGYPAIPFFDAYEITGDAEGWLASLGVPAVSVELSSHNTVEWPKNRAGMKAILDYYSQP